MHTIGNLVAAAVLLLSAANVASAKPAASVEFLQSPAWLVRGGADVPLEAGSVLQSGDVIRTGQRARIRIRLEEGSDIRLGANARLELPRIAAPEDEAGLFEGLISVLKGAFRFTTGQVGADRSRKVDIRVGAVTAGIRGTDIWGKAAPERDFVVLIEGEIEVGTRELTSRLTEAGTAFIQPKTGPARPAEPIPMETISRFALETEPVAERGRLTEGGKWNVNLDSLRDRKRAEHARARYHEAGFPVRLQTVRVGGEQWNRVFLAGADTRESARIWAREFERRFGVKGAWVRQAID